MVAKDLEDENILLHREDKYDIVSTKQMSTEDEKLNKVSDILCIKMDALECPEGEFTAAIIENKTRAFERAK